MLLIQQKGAFVQDKRAWSVGGGAENRTPVHGESLVRLYKLSRCSGLEAARRNDGRCSLESVRS